ncbi:DUF3883 domain-containing protein [Novosphingobium sp.]|uniref:DUF3883 domain-containing protein n=1 Tax=Novosphingobium sp. TaxID=1874826 RepID=UPI0038B71188
MSEHWSDAENAAIVADYFAMLADDIAEVAYVKVAHNSALQALTGRSKGSIEFKHQNISAVLQRFGQPWITGYKPAVNFQDALIDAVRRWLDAHPDWLAVPRWFARSGLALAEEPTIGQGGNRADRLAENVPPLWFGSPPTQANEPPPIEPAVLAAFGRKWDVAERDARNRALGRAGEALVLHHERTTLLAHGRDDLADKVRWTSDADGDGYGYDIRSFETDGRDRLIEVKTTNGWNRTPFHISANELAVADAHRDSWHLVRVHDFARKPGAFALRPPLQAHATLTPTSFLAALL